MSVVTCFIAALVHGMEAAELDVWVSGLRGRSGEDLRTLWQHAPPDDRVRKIRNWVEEHHDDAARLLPSLLRFNIRRDAREETIITEYLAVLNSIAGAAICCGRPLVLRGFFHCADRLSYWYFDSARLESLNRFKKDPREDLIKCGGTKPRIFMLDDPSTDDRVTALNLEIRRSPLKRLPRSLVVGRPEVHAVREFLVGFTPGDPDAEIPLGAPGIIEMMSSLPVALDAQRMPEAELQRIVAAATAGIGHL